MLSPCANKGLKEIFFKNGLWGEGYSLGDIDFFIAPSLTKGNTDKNEKKMNH